MALCSFRYRQIGIIWQLINVTNGAINSALFTLFSDMRACLTTIPLHVQHLQPLLKLHYFDLFRCTYIICTTNPQQMEVMDFEHIG